MKIISIREQPEFRDTAILYFQKNWSDVRPETYEDCITYSIGTRYELPKWNLVQKEDDIVGCAGLITNDFISRSDLYPWFAALFIEESQRGNKYPSLLLEQAKADTRQAGFKDLYLCTEHIGYYERHGFSYIGDGYHPWGGSSRIYEIQV